MNLRKDLISYGICLLICVSLFWACMPTIQQGKVEIEYENGNIDKIANIGVLNSENKIHSFGYFKNDTIANRLIALFSKNGNLKYFISYSKKV